MTNTQLYIRPFLGRTTERSTLYQILQNAERQENRTRLPQCALIEGEAGIGKTRLAEEFRHEAEQRGWTVLWIRSYPEHAIAYHLWTQVLRQLLARKLWQFNARRKNSPLYQPLLALLPEEARPSHLSLDMPGEPLRLWEAVLTILSEVSKKAPFLLVCDDMHALDERSIDLFGFLARHLPHQLLLVGTYRGYDRSVMALHHLIAHLLREEHITVLHLGPLSDEHIQALLASMPHMTESTMRQQIQQRAAGNPFFAEELARTSLFGVSATLEAALESRLQQLSPDCHRLLQAASVVGSSFDFSLLSHLGIVPGNEDILLTLLEEALQASILREDGETHVPSYRFSHPLLGSYLYNSLSAGRRAKTHRRVATVLLEMLQGRAHEQAEMVTHHLIEGRGDSSQILLYAEIAADRAYGLSAFTEAERYLHNAVEQREQQLSRQETAIDLHLASLLERLGECTRIRGADEEARPLYHRALSIHQHQEKNSAVIENTQLQALLWCEIGQTWYNTGKYDQAEFSYQQGEQVLSQSGIPPGTAFARIRFEQSYLLWRRGSYDDADTTGREALAVFRRVMPFHQGKSALSPLSSMRSTLAGDPVDIARCSVILGLVANSRGRPGEAIEHWTAALTIFEQFRRVREIANVSCDLGDIFLKEANHPAAHTVLTRALELAERVDDVPLMSIVYGNLANLAARTGNLVGAEDLLRRALVLAQQANEPLYESILSSYLASVLRDQGLIAEARLSLARALRLSRTLRNLPSLAQALVTLADFYLSLALVPSPKHPLVQQTRRLERIQRLVVQAIQMKGVEGETKAEGFLLLTEVDLELDAKGTVWDHIQEALRIVQTSSLHWLLPRTYTLLTRVLASQGQQEQADSYFRQALALFQQHTLRVDHARALYQYGRVLMHLHKETDQDYVQGVSYVREAFSLCQQSEVMWDMHVIEQVLTTVSLDQAQE